MINSKRGIRRDHYRSLCIMLNKQRRIIPTKLSSYSQSYSTPLLNFSTTSAFLKKFLQELDAVIERAKQSEVDESAQDDAEEDEMSMYCITCGHEIHSRTAIKHMEKCFNKV